jgi:hypothetical protein
LNKYPGIPYTLVGDPTGGNQQSQTEEMTCVLELQEAGIICQSARTNNFLARREAVVGYLNRLVDGQPGFLLSPNCKTLRKGFQGGYHYRKMRVVGSAQFAEKAEKNIYSHPHDGLQAACLEAEGVGTGLNQTSSQFSSSQRRKVVTLSSAGWT